MEEEIEYLSERIEELIKKRDHKQRILDELKRRESIEVKILNKEIELLESIRRHIL